MYGQSKLVFHADLDNTLIYSCRHEIGQDKVCVELYQGREVSFMTSRSMRLLRQVKEKTVFVPTTTRTKEQYDRICMGAGVLDYALVCNGGVLLVGGKVDEDWYQASLRLVSKCREELKTAARLLERDENRTLDVRNIRDLFLFTKSADPIASAAKLRAILDPGLIDIFLNGVKVYVLPKHLDKGTAVRRFADRVQAGKIIAAGDSTFDLPMLEAAETALAPETLAKMCRPGGHVIGVGKDQVFSDAVLEYVLSVLKQ